MTHHRSIRTAIVLVLVTASAGLALAGDVPDPMSEEHAHADPSLHRLAWGDLSLVGHLDPPKGAADGGGAAARVAPDWSEELGFEPLDGLGGAYFGEVDARGDLVFLAQLKPPAGVHVLDVSDRAAPMEVGRWNVPSGSGGITDVKVSRDGRFVYAAYQGSSSDSRNGVYVLDVTDPTMPRDVSHFAVPGSGVHMLFVTEVAGQEVVLAPTAAGGGMPIAVTVDHPLTGVRTLVQAALWNSGSSPHDVYVYDDPLLGVPLVVVADGGQGVVITALGSPSSPSTLGRWSYQGAPRFYAHTVRATVEDGKRYVIVSPEGGALGMGIEEVAKLWVLDATDPTKITVAGSWGNPGDHPAREFLHSTHNFQLVDGRVYLAHNHGGVWILDLDGPTLTPRAYLLPAEHATTSTPGGSIIQNSIPAVWDVVVKEGLVYAGDRSGGLYVMHFGEDELGPGGPTSYG